MSKTLFVFAQAAEAKPTIAALNAFPVAGEYNEIHTEGEVPSCYHFSKGWIILTNMGSLSAAQAVLKYLYKYDIQEVINLGFAASLESNAIIGEIHQVALVGKHALLPRNIDEGSRHCYEALHPKHIIAMEGKRLVTSDYPIHHPELKNELKTNWELLDMEGYGIAHVTLALRKRLSLYKIISDFASNGGRELIRKHKIMLAEKLAEKALQLLRK